ncbi:hypothetical protein [Olivibacter domesticus]|uniref:Uncharacterized protein n=1 Tax=Olivibacter domesticus TaxID=407022 RepID=A0A1H7GP20_OLID1|nr:hypothetical protein [Olivibacter domesticus]SEK39804.1 hypothetical protein SAMN05661044_00146 [Olivibacter domesticus]
MANLNKDLIRKNIFKLIDYSGVTDVSFANLLEISDKQLKRIKKGEADFSIDNINRACNFFRKSLASINKTELEIDRLFRDKLIVTHKGNIEYSKILEDRPSITYAINFELLSNEEFINKGLTVKKIRELFRARNWEFSSAYISLAMSRNQDKIARRKNEADKFVYKEII